jgi:hypothetical protein
MIVAAGAFRLLSYKYPYVLSNFTPVGAIALFGGAYFTDKWKACLVPLLTLFVSDMALNYLYAGKMVFYSESLWVYACFAIIVFIGSLIKKATVVSVLMASVVSVLIHWLFIDMPWLYGNNLYPNTLAGYGHSLIAAIPFEKNMLLGDAIFGLILFGGFEFAKSKYTTLRAGREFAV